jgi:hypothetical protein
MNHYILRHGLVDRMGGMLIFSACIVAVLLASTRYSRHHHSSERRQHDGGRERSHHSERQVESRHSSRSSSRQPVMNVEGKCGVNNPCPHWAPCCSKWGYCGNDAAHCVAPNCIFGCWDESSETSSRHRSSRSTRSYHRPGREESYHEVTMKRGPRRVIDSRRDEDDISPTNKPHTKANYFSRSHQ